MDVTRIEALFKQELKVISVGIEIFAAELRKCKVEVIHLDWHPPAGGKIELLKILENIRKK